MGSMLLSLIIFTPLVLGLVVLILPGRGKQIPRTIALLASILQMMIGAVILFNFSLDYGSQFQMQEHSDWINLSLGTLGQFVVGYHLGVDGLSIGLLVLAIFVMLIGVISSWKISDKPKAYYALLLLLNGSVMGCFLALDFFLFYIFFEFMLLPMYFLIGIWGGVRRLYASIKFFLYTLLGSLLILIVMIALYLSYQDPTGTTNTFDLVHMMDLNNLKDGSALALDSSVQWFGYDFRSVAFVLLILGFAIKVPSVPLHTWLPDAHVEAPTPVSVILAGVLLKIGGYGILRIAYPVFPDVAVQMGGFVGTLGVISIIYGALNALAQKDLKRLIAYSSVSHMGFVLLGIAAVTVESISGATYQMISHGVITTMLFLIAGVIYDRTGDRAIENFGGLAAKMPRYATITAIAFFAGLGLPGFSGFVAELLVLLGSFRSDYISLWMVVGAIIGILLAAVYFLWTIQRIFFGSFFIRKEEYGSMLSDLDRREMIMLIPLALITLILGVFPNILLSRINEGMEIIVQQIHSFSGI